MHRVTDVSAEPLGGRGTVLVVDDVSENVEILGKILSREYRVQVAMSGADALALIEDGSHPDVILLDILMPEMDGYETCRRLKANPATRHIPVIFVSALCDDGDEFRGLALGAVDYVTKPFNPQLVAQRVRTHMTLQSAQRELRQHNEHLEEVVRARTRALAEAHQRLLWRDRTKSDYLRAVSHELRTPANGVLGVGQLAIDEVGNPAMREKLSGLFERSRVRLQETLDGAMRLADLQTGDASLDVQSFEMGSLIRLVAAAFPGVVVGDEGPPSASGRPPRVIGDEVLTSLALRTLVRAMVRLKRPGASVTVTGGNEGPWFTVSIESSEVTLPEAAHASFFATFSSERTATFVEDMGLAIPLAARNIEAMGGRVAIDAPGPGELRLRCSLARAGGAQANLGDPGQA